MTLTPLHESLEPSTDEYTNKWYRDYFRTICWRIVNAETHVVDQVHQVKMLRKQVQEITTAREQDAVRIGKLTAEKEEQGSRITALENQLADAIGRLDRQGEFLQTLKTKGK